jgi:hypothetical protein
MAGLSLLRGREPRLRLILPRGPGLVSVSQGHPLSRSSAAPHAPTMTRGTPRSHYVGFAETRPGLRHSPQDRRARGRGLGRWAWTLLAARPRPAAFRACPVRADAHLLRSPRRHPPAGVGRDRFPRAVRGPAAAPWATVLRGRLAFVRLGLRLAPWSPSSPSAPPMRCPGSGLQRSRRLGLEASRSPCRSRGIAASHIRPRWRSFLRRRCNLLASQVPRRGHLHYLQRHSRAANLVPLHGRVIGELSRSPGQASCATSGDAFRIGSG